MLSGSRDQGADALDDDETICQSLRVWVLNHHAFLHPSIAAEKISSMGGGRGVVMMGCDQPKGIGVTDVGTVTATSNSTVMDAGTVVAAIPANLMLTRNVAIAAIMAPTLHCRPANVRRMLGRTVMIDTPSSGKAAVDITNRQQHYDYLQSLPTSFLLAVFLIDRRLCYEFFAWQQHTKKLNSADNSPTAVVPGTTPAPTRGVPSSFLSPLYMAPWIQALPVQYDNVLELEDEMHFNAASPGTKDKIRHLKHVDAAIPPSPQHDAAHRDMMTAMRTLALRRLLPIPRYTSRITDELRRWEEHAAYLENNRHVLLPCFFPAFTENREPSPLFAESGYFADSDRSACGLYGTDDENNADKISISAVMTVTKNSKVEDNSDSDRTLGDTDNDDTECDLEANNDQKKRATQLTKRRKGTRSTVAGARNKHTEQRGKNTEGTESTMNIQAPGEYSTTLGYSVDDKAHDCDTIQTVIGEEMEEFFAHMADSRGMCRTELWRYYYRWGYNSVMSRGFGHTEDLASFSSSLQKHALSSSDPEDSSALKATTSQRLFSRTLSLLSARAFKGVKTIYHAGYWAMMPWVDYFNYSSTPNVSATYSSTKKCWFFTTKKDLAAPSSACSGLSSITETGKHAAQEVNKRSRNGALVGAEAAITEQQPRKISPQEDTCPKEPVGNPQLLIQYGQYSDIELLLWYGFTLCSHVPAPQGGETKDHDKKLPTHGHQVDCAYRFTPLLDPDGEIPTHKNWLEMLLQKSKLRCPKSLKAARRNIATTSQKSSTTHPASNIHGQQQQKMENGPDTNFSTPFFSTFTDGGIEDIIGTLPVQVGRQSGVSHNLAAICVAVAAVNYVGDALADESSSTKSNPNSKMIHKVTSASRSHGKGTNAQQQQLTITPGTVLKRLVMAELEDIEEERQNVIKQLHEQNVSIRVNAEEHSAIENDDTSAHAMDANDSAVPKSTIVLNGVVTRQLCQVYTDSVQLLQCIAALDTSHCDRLVRSAGTWVD